MSKPAHALKYEEAVSELGANASDGLTSGEASSRLSDYGRNELDNGPGVSPTKILIRQVANAMMLVKRTTSTVTVELLVLILCRS